MQATLAEPEIVTRPGQPVSVIMPIKDCEAHSARAGVAGDEIWLKRAAPNSKPATWHMELRAAAGASEDEALKRGMEEKSKEFVEKGADVYIK